MKIQKSLKTPKLLSTHIVFGRAQRAIASRQRITVYFNVYTWIRANCSQKGVVLTVKMGANRRQIHVPKILPYFY